MLWLVAVHAVKAAVEQLCVDGLVNGVACKGVALLAHLSHYAVTSRVLGSSAWTRGYFLDPSTAVARHCGGDVWGWAKDGREYALLCLGHSTGFLDVTDGANPVVVGHLPSPSGVLPSTWCDIKVVGRTMYKVAEAVGHGIQIFDLERMHAAAMEAAGSRAFVADGVHQLAGQSGRVHNLVANPESGLVLAVGLYPYWSTSPVSCSTSGVYALRANADGSLSDVGHQVESAALAVPQRTSPASSDRFL